MSFDVTNHLQRLLEDEQRKTAVLEAELRMLRETRDKWFAYLGNSHRQQGADLYACYVLSCVFRGEEPG